MKPTSEQTQIAIPTEATKGCTPAEASLPKPDHVHIVRAARGVIRDRDICCLGSNHAGFKRDGDRTTVAGWQCPFAIISLREITGVCAGDCQARDLQRGASTVGQLQSVRRA